MYKEVVGNQAIKFISTKPTMIITTLHENMKVNAGVFGAYTNLSSEHIGVAVSPKSDTYKNILRTGEFTINVPPVDIIKAIKILAHNEPEGVSEVEKAGLSVKLPITNKTPAISECVAAVECVFEQKLPTGSHTFIVAKVTGGWIKNFAMTEEGRLDIFKGRVFKDFCYPKPLYVLPGEVVQG
jgi:flavin reductase (DIM6/NTAB) family NADH-FMN oxidoreductase RutF